MVRIWLDSFRSEPGRISATQRGYTIDVRAFRAFTDKPMRQIIVRDIQAFAATLGHLAPASQARRLSAIKSLFTMAHELGYVPFGRGPPGAAASGQGQAGRAHHVRGRDAALAVARN
jgi:site-specific recombinase XerD